jgi:dTDP-4-amino-4,6-dideoxygalactose transaminase
LRAVKVPLFDPRIQNAALRDEAMEKFAAVFDSGSFILGDGVEEFEKNVARYLGTEHAIGMSSGTDAILAALMAIGVGPGDEVICPSFSFFATAGCVARLGATPVFADIEAVDFNVSIAAVGEKITARTKAIIPVHLFGQTANMDALVAMADEFCIPIVEDCAQSFGARCGGRQSGTFGLAGCFSFFPTKNLGGFGDAGLVCTDDGAFAERLRMIRVHGARPQYFHRFIGGNFRIDELQAALLNVKLPHVDGYIAGRRRNAEFYLRELADAPSIVLPAAVDGNFHSWNQFTIRVMDGRRDGVLNALRAADIGCNVYYPLPLDAQECLRSTEPTRNAAAAAAEVLSLPIYPELEEWQLAHVAKTLKHILRR